MTSVNPQIQIIKNVVVAGLITAASLLLAGCGGGSSSASQATLNLAMVDGPVDTASSVVVQFTGVELQPSGAANSMTFVFPSPKQIDLVQLQNGNAASLLSGVTVPAGQYDWMRLLLTVDSQNAVTGSYIEISGNQYPIIVPSGAQTGLKLVQGFTMTANQVANFTIDFVLQQAIAAPSGQTVNGVQAYLLRPALRLINNVQAGQISGSVTLSTLQSLNPTCFDSNGNPTAHVYIFAGSGATLTDIQVDPTTGLPPSGHVNPVVTPPVTYSSGQYVYGQPYLLAGPYTLAIACGSDDPSTADQLAFAPPSGTGATVTANQTTVVNF